MKYYSEKTNKTYDTVEALEDAEKKLEVQKAEDQKKLDEKKSRAHEVEEAYKKTISAREEARKIIKEADDAYYKLRDKFVNDYGSYHISYYNNGKDRNITVSDLLDSFFDTFDNNFFLPWRF